MARVRYEQRSTLLALETYLNSVGWSEQNITYSDGYQSDETITNPQVVVTFPPSNAATLQIGNNGDKLFRRVITVNCYMESEPRAQSIVDDIMDFMVDACIFIVAPNGDSLGTLICQDENSVRGQVFPPIMTTPKLLRWRGAAQGTFESFYPTPEVLVPLSSIGFAQAEII